MTAKEFYELNKGKYFRLNNNQLNGETVRIVGYTSDLIIAASIFGDIIDTSNIQYKKIDFNLFDGYLGAVFAHVEELSEINSEPQEIDLCEILKGCEGVELWSDIFGKCILVSVNNTNSYKILVSVSYKDGKGIDYQTFTKYGKFYDCYPNGKCMLWPSETNRDWSTFKKPIKEGMPCMCKNADSDIWVLRTERQASYTYCVPVENFDFNDIENNISRSII